MRLAKRFEVRSYRDGKVRTAIFERGILQSDKTTKTTDENGTFIFFEPDNQLFLNYRFHDDIIETMLRNYTYLNTGLSIMYNGRRIMSRNGLADLLTDTMTYRRAFIPLYTSLVKILRSHLPILTSMEKSITRSLTDNIQPKEVLIKQHLKSI